MQRIKVVHNYNGYYTKFIKYASIYPDKTARFGLRLYFRVGLRVQIVPRYNILWTGPDFGNITANFVLDKKKKKTV